MNTYTSVIMKFELLIYFFIDRLINYVPVNILQAWSSLTQLFVKEIFFFYEAI